VSFKFQSIFDVIREFPGTLPPCPVTLDKHGIRVIRQRVQLMNACILRSELTGVKSIGMFLNAEGVEDRKGRNVLSGLVIGAPGIS